MATDLKTIRVIDFDGKPSNWEGWSEKFLARAKRKGYKKLLLGTERVPTQSEYDQAVVDNVRMTMTRGEKNEEAFEDIILSINHASKQGKVAFSLVKNCKSDDYPEGNCKLAFDRLLAKYAPKTAPSLLKLKKKFANSKLESSKKHPDEWITELESLRNDMDQIHISSRMSDLDFLIHVLNNLPELYDVVLDGMESKLMLADTDPNKLKIEDVRDKLNSRYERIIDHAKESRELEDDDGSEEKALLAWQSQYKGVCYKCGVYGHKGTDCKGNFKGKCWTCGKHGHKSEVCDSRKSQNQEGTNHEKAQLTLDDSDDESINELGF